MFKTAQQRFMAGEYESQRMRDPEILRVLPIWSTEVVLETEVILAVVREDLERDHGTRFLPQTVRDKIWRMATSRLAEEGGMTVSSEAMKGVILTYFTICFGAKTTYRNLSQEQA